MTAGGERADERPARDARHAPAAVLRDAEQAGRLRRLPAPLPVRLRRPADPAEGPALGAQHRRRRRCTPRCGRGGTCRSSSRTTGAARQLLYSAWSQNGFRDAEQSERWRARAAGWLTDYVADARSHRRAGRQRAHRRRDHRAAGAVRPDRPDRPARRRARDRRLQDRPGAVAPTTRPAGHPRWPPTCSASGARCAGRAPGSSCTTCPAARSPSFEHTDRSLANHVRRAEDIAVDITRGDRGAGRGRGPGRRRSRRPGPAVQLVRLPAELPDRAGRRPGAGDVELPRRGRRRRLSAQAAAVAPATRSKPPHTIGERRTRCGQPQHRLPEGLAAPPSPRRR